MTSPRPDTLNQSTLVQRLRRKTQLMPMLGGGSLKIYGVYPHEPVEIKTYITDDGMRLINPDGPDAADAIEALQAENERMREALHRIESQALCVALRHVPEEADDWLHGIYGQANAALAEATS